MIRKKLFTIATVAMLSTACAISFAGCSMATTARDTVESTESTESDTIDDKIEAAFEDEDYDKVISLCTKAIKNNDTKTKYYLDLSEAYIALGKLDEAQQILEDGLEKITKERDVNKLQAALDDVNNKLSQEHEALVAEPTEEVEPVEETEITEDIDEISEAIESIETEIDELTNVIDSNGHANTDLPTEWISKTNRCFAINGHVYTLGQSTVQDMIDDGIVFADDSMATINNVLNSNYQSPYIQLWINKDKWYYACIYAGNFTDDNKTIAECPITEITFDYNPEYEMTDNVLEFSFGWDITEESLVATCGEPTDTYNYVSDTFEGHFSNSYFYEWTNEKYLGKSGYKFEFDEDGFARILISYEP